MFRNYLLTAFRNLLHNKGRFFVNITGLIVGFSAFLLIFPVLAYEQSYDGYHAKKDRIYRVGHSFIKAAIANPVKSLTAE